VARAELGSTRRYGARVSLPASAAPVSGRRALRLVGLGALVGIPAALVAALFLAVVHKLEHWLWHDLPEHLHATGPPWYLVLGLPVAGACIVLAARRLLPGDGGHEPIEGIKTEPTPLSYAPGIALAAVGSLAFGAVLGPEGPLIALGSVVGAAVVPLARLDAQEGRVLSLAGSFSAISALFGGPLVAGMLLLEGGVGLGAAIVPVLVPGLVAASIGFLIFVGFGSWGGLDTTAISVPGLPVYQGTHIRDLVIAIAVGVIAAVLIHAVRGLATRIAGPGRARVGMAALLMSGGLAVGALALLADGLGASSQDVLFSGQASIPGLVAEDSAKIVLVLLAAKALGYAICLGCGFRGGPVFPAIFLGIALTTLAVIAFDVSPTLAIAVGTAAGTAATTRLLFASVLFAGILVGTAGLDAIPAAALAAVAAWLTIAAIDERFPAFRRSA
jgi:H+/Cl- antiporter ClcA